MQAGVIERIEMKLSLSRVCGPAVMLFALTAQCQPAPVPVNGVLNLSTAATVEVTKDVLGVSFTVTREGADAQAVQSALKQALEAALAEARKIVKPGAVEVQTGNFALYPRYRDPVKGGQATISGWQGSAELMVQGKDIAAIAQLSGRIQTMSIARVGYSLSREAREKVEADVAAEAIARFRVRAEAVSKQFGFAGYTVREVAVASEGAQYQPQPLAMRAQAMRSGADEALPVEAGKAQVTATVSGSVQMK